MSVALICGPLFILCIIAAEFMLSADPITGKPYNIGQWTPWAAVGLILGAALIGNYHRSVVTIIRHSWRDHVTSASRNEPLSAHLPRPFGTRKSRGGRSRTSGENAGIEVPTITAAVVVAMGKVLHFFWDPLRNGVQRSVVRLHAGFADAVAWLHDPQLSEDTDRHPRQDAGEEGTPYSVAVEEEY